MRALAAGADDYVTKPFGPRELVARLQAALRRADPGASEPVIRADGLELDLAAHTVRIDGAAVHLTPIEFNLLRVLARNRGRLMTHRALLIEVWGPEYADDVQVLRVHIANLRRKIGERATSAPTPASGTASRLRVFNGPLRNLYTAARVLYAPLIDAVPASRAWTSSPSHWPCWPSSRSTA